MPQRASEFAARQVLGESAADPMADELPDVLTPEQTAAYLQVARHTIYRFVQERKIPIAKFGRVIRIRRSDIEALFDSASQLVIDRANEGT